MKKRIHLGPADGGSRRAGEPPRGSDAYDRVLFENTPIGLALCRMDGSLVDVNPAFVRILGRTVEETLSLTYWDLTPRSYEEEEAAQLANLEKTGRYGPYEKEYFHKDGHLVPVCLQGSILELQGERFIWSSVEDITERRRAQHALGVAHGRVAEILESVTDAFVSLDTDWRYTYLNRRAGEIFGRQPEDLVGKHIWTEFPEGVGQPFYQAYYRAARGQVPIQLEEYYPPYDRWFENRIYPSPEGLSIFFHDITERKKAEKQLRESERRFRATLENVELLAVTLNADATIDFCNDYMLGLTGWRREEALGKSWFDVFVPQEIRAQVQNVFTAALEAGEIPMHYENEILTRGGERRLIRWNNTTLMDAEGVVTGTVSLGEDITDRKRAEEALRESEARIRNVLEQANDGIYVISAENRYLDANARGIELLGYTREELLEMSVADVLAPHEVARLAVEPPKMMSGEPHLAEWEHVRKDGSVFPGEVSARRLDDRSYLAIVRDLTERRRAEALLEDQRALLEMVARGVPLADTLHALVTRIEARSPGMRGSVLLLDEDGRHVRHGAAPSLPEGYNRAIEGAAIGPRAGSCGTAAWRREQVIVTDIATDPLWEDYRDLALAYGLRACWSTPILSSAGGVLGTFAMYYSEPRAPTAEDLRLIESATGLARIAIERRNAEAELRTANEELRTVNRVMTTITGVVDIKVILEQVLDEALQIAGLEGGTICLLREDGALGLVAERATSQATIEDLTTNLVKVGDCLCGSCARDCKPLILRTLEEVRAYATRESNREETIRFHAAFPLVTARACEGVLCVFTRGQERPRERSLELLETLSAQTALAIRNARLFREVEAHAAALEERVRERTAQLETAKAQTESALERATAADRAKSAFLAAMSHELRTPLNSVIGFTGGLLGGLVGALTTEQREALEIVQRNGRHLLDLINDVLDLSRIEAGEMRLAVGRFDLAELVRHDVESVGPQAAAKGLKVSLELPAPELPFRGDARHVSQILLNLLSNAIKFTDRGEVRIRVRKVTEPKGTEDIEVDVMDTGMGIAEADMPRLFREFEQLDSGLGRRQNGTGLGLALSRRLARLMGGEITAQSALGEGSTFTLRLPSGGRA